RAVVEDIVPRKFGAVAGGLLGECEIGDDPRRIMASGAGLRLEFFDDVMRDETRGAENDLVRFDGELGSRFRIDDVDGRVVAGLGDPVSETVRANMGG